MIIFTFTLTCIIIPFLFWITCCTIEFAFTIIWNMFCHCFSFIFVCYHIKCFNMSFVSFGTHIFLDKTLQLPVRLFKLIMNGYYLSSAWFISVIVGVIMHDSLFKKRHFARSATHAKELNNAINPKIILHYF